MKRSSQVALVLMGVTATTAAGAYMMPPRPECRAEPAPAAAPAPPSLTGDAPAAVPQQQPCRRRSWGPWNWSSNSSRSYYSYDNRSSSPRSWFPSTRTTTVSRPSTSTVPHTSTGIRTSVPSTPRSGFGITGRSMSPGG
jgi:hypothetical protein